MVSVYVLQETDGHANWGYSDRGGVLHLNKRHRHKGPYLDLRYKD